MASALIDFPDRNGGRSVRRLYSDPVAVLSTFNVGDVRALLAEVDAATRLRGLHAVGYLSYEAAPAFDRAFRVHAGGTLPLAWFALFRDYEVSAVPEQSAARQSPGPWTIDVTRAEYDDAIAFTRAAIAEGRTYQVNLTARLRAAFNGDSRAWYESLRRAQGSGYHAYLNLGSVTILSASPELFFERRGCRINARPMKGTQARGRFPVEDDCRAHELRNSAKDRAENLMIVDLVRNDLGRIAVTGTVEARDLFQLERYRTVWQLTSTVRAQLPDSIGLPDIFGALFPCGSVTGAPKISTMQIIAQLERSPRQVYCGALGVVEPGGDCTFNVPIRTVWIDHGSGQAEYGVGSGVTWDSLPSGEYEELRSKSLILTESWPHFELLETMRLQDGEYLRLERHLNRLRASCRYFGFSFCEEPIRQQLAELALKPGNWRVRLLLSDAGNIRLESSPIVQESHEAYYAVAECAVDSADRFLFHKTTQRAVYDRALSAQADVFDVLLWNERDELTEFTRGNVVVELDGVKVTPPIGSGLLAGTMRGELLERGVIEERVIYRSDLARASRVWMINSVREWVELTAK